MTRSVEIAKLDNPYKNFPFRVKCGNTYVAGVIKVSSASLPMVKSNERVDLTTTPLAPGQTLYEPLGLARGVSYDEDFGKWLVKAWESPNVERTQSARGTSLEDFRKDLIIEQYDESGQMIHTYAAYRCWASESVVMPNLDGPANALVIQSITLQNEGWTFDLNLAK